jgi:4,5-dihydroxyphthalate decarboxylase
MSNRVPITLAGGSYDRTIALVDGRVRPRGVDLTYLGMPIEEVFWRAFRHREFDAAELSLGYYLTLCSQGDDGYVAIPVFPSRFFRHGCVYVAADSELTSFESLSGATIGIPEYTMTACVWLRGLLSEEHNVQPEDIHWRYGGIEAPGRRDRADMAVPPGIDLQSIGPDETLNQLLCDGKLDAVICPRLLSGYFSGRIRRLLPDYQSAEREYYDRTGIFPMMHVVALRRDIYERTPWVAASLFDAYQEAKSVAYDWLADINALPISLPWFVPEWERTRELFGRDPYPDGLEANRAGLETFARYLHDQRMTVQLTDLDSVFAPNTLDKFVI